METTFLDALNLLLNSTGKYRDKFSVEQDGSFIVLTTGDQILPCMNSICLLAEAFSRYVGIQHSGDKFKVFISAL